mmetsp:Transcript_55480/g.168662  ORF Transcript_55480/g.168662 Transcript_55480/m.168662 type:complete len:282 (-) Transcript_55480:1970-2815(-)
MSITSCASWRPSMPASPSANSFADTAPSPIFSALPLSPVALGPSSFGWSDVQASRKNWTNSMPPRRLRGSPRASSYSIMSSSGRLASFRPSSTSLLCKSSDKSSQAKHGLGPAAQLTFPEDPRKTGNMADFNDALNVEAARIVCKRPPLIGKTEKNWSSVMPLKITCEQQWLINSCIAPQITPSSNILFQLLSNEGSPSPSSGRGNAFREESSANPPWIHAELFVLKGVGKPTQIRPQRCSSSKGRTLTAVAPWGYKATPNGRSNCSFKIFSMPWSEMPRR